MYREVFARFSSPAMFEGLSRVASNSRDERGPPHEAVDPTKWNADLSTSSKRKPEHGKLTTMYYKWNCTDVHIYIIPTLQDGLQCKFKYLNQISWVNFIGRYPPANQIFWSAENFTTCRAFIYPCCWTKPISHPEISNKWKKLTALTTWLSVAWKDAISCVGKFEMKPIVSARRIAQPEGRR